LAPCNSQLFDELRNIYQIIGPYALSCSDPIEFNYTDHIQKWHKYLCGKDPSVDKGWEKVDSVEKVVGGSDLYKAFVANDGCGYRQWCKARYRCWRHKQLLQRCHWQETSLQVMVNNQTKEVIQTHLTQGAVVQAAYGFWRNESAIFLNTASNNFLEGTNYNYTCAPKGGLPPVRHDYYMEKPSTLNPLPQLVECNTLIQIPFIITNGGLPWCEAILVVNNTETGGIGFELGLGGRECVVKVQDDSDTIFYIVIHSGSYRFFQEVKGINCIDAGEGVYTNCGSDNFTTIIPKQMGYDTGAEIEVVSPIDEAGSGSSLFSWPSLFGNVFSSNIITAIQYITIAVIAVVGLVIGIILLRCLISHCQARRKDVDLD
jgi:hypothetical protein